LNTTVLENQISILYVRFEAFMAVKIQMEFFLGCDAM